MGDEKKEEKLLQWHSAFFADLQIELAEEAEYLTFENEHMLATKPMQMDVLVIKKDSTRQIRKNIGRIFRGHNIVEYKSPTDSLSIDDFFKVYGYACFYKSDTQRVNEIKSEDVTITFVSMRYPREMCKHLEQVLQRRITEAGPGIYYISDSVFLIQLLVQKRLSEVENFWLKSLTNDLREKQNVDRLIMEYRKHEEDTLYQSVMNIIVDANAERFQVNDMCEALDRIVDYHVQRIVSEREKELIGVWTERGMTQGLAQGMEQGLAQGMEQGLAQGMEQGLAQGMEQGLAQGIAQGIAQGSEQSRKDLIAKKLLKNKPFSQIADELEETEEVIRPLYEQVKAELQMN